MQQLLGGKAPFHISLLCELYLQLLPANVQTILVSANEMSIDKLAELADRIMDVATPFVTTVSASTLDDGIRGLISKRSIRSYEHRKCHASEVFLTQMEGGGTVRVGGPLHMDVHPKDNQSRTLCVGTTRDS